MCGRFTLHSPVNSIMSRFSLSQLDFEYIPNYNVAPTQQVLTVIAANGRHRASLMRWGLVPPWQKGASGSRPIINARFETIAERKTFKGLVDSYRCLILADGFYEWREENSGKHPVYITLKSGEPFAFVGLWDGEAEPSCTIITTAANAFLKPIHHRMPLISTPTLENTWLGNDPFRAIQGTLASMDAPAMKFHRVSTLVNSPRNNGSDCIQPLGLSQPQQKT